MVVNYLLIAAKKGEQLAQEQLVLNAAYLFMLEMSTYPSLTIEANFLFQGL